MRLIGPFLAALSLPACATAPITQSGSLKSYQGLAQSDGIQTKSLIRVNKQNVLAAKTVKILPTRFADHSGSDLPNPDRTLVANVINRSLCHALSERFEVVAPTQPADLSVRATVTQITPTDEVAAGVSVAANIAATALNVPGPKPRLPIGLGSLTIEAEALSRTNEQEAAMVWARGANSFVSSPKVSKVGDAYDLGSSFGDDFSQLLVTGETPFGKMGSLPSIPSSRRIGDWLGAKPKHETCETFGRAPGIAGVVAGRFGLPPNWTDRGGQVASDAVKPGGEAPR
ncbi:DUF3313 domain-containing protein [Bosea sp. (in: a-proteobacteria)]|jgi:hypothetical protein|uniref:DUF3313 domain-containing protein n=1 Tax=Bosea sp. (in: a-proteobacteria) TaxID=1871050 RepID=UPI003F6EBBEA